MFTGLIEDVGRIARVSPRSGSKRITVATALAGQGTGEGDSIAVDGVCLTVAALGADRFDADVVQETLNRTTLGRLRAGQTVNLERSVRLGDRMGGHLVQGHVDGIVSVSELRRHGDDHRLRFELEPALAKYVAMKGSVALHGVSLTVAGVGPGWFEVVLVPFTLDATTLSGLRVGDRVNVEVDVVARYLERLTGGAGPSRPAADGPDRGPGPRSTGGA